MKIFLKAALLLLWLTITSNAQSPRSGSEPDKSTAEIPTMQEWWRADGISNGKGISYLPNFKDGHNALVVSMANGEVHTWLNRFPGDTQNVFTWASDLSDLNDRISYGDFNSDGIRDYITSDGFLYRGIQNGQPPETTPVKQYKIGGIHKIYDFNKDGFDDIYEGHSTIIYGGSDLKNLTQSSGGQGPFDETRLLAALYETAQGDFRFVIKNTKAKEYDGYELYRATWEKSGIQPIFEKLDAINHSLFPSNKEFLYINGFQALYQSKKNGKPFFIATESLDGNWSNIIRTNIVIFDLSNDKFTEHLKFRMDSISIISVLEHSIDGDEYEDWYVIKRPVDGIHKILLFSGGTTLNDTPRMIGNNFLMGSIVSITDVSGDSINEIAVGYRDIGILKGIDLTTGLSDLENDESFVLSKPVPHPIQRRQTALIPVSILKPDSYTLSLYSIEGQQIAEVFKGYIDGGMHHLSLNPAEHTVAPGVYLLRLFNGTESVERTIIITN